MNVRSNLVIALLAVNLALVGCKKESSGSGTAPAGAQSSKASHEGQGAVVTSDPAFEVKLKLGDTGPQITLPTQQLAIFESKPAKAGQQTQRPQGFELRGEGVTLAGVLPEKVKLAPQQNYDILVDQPLKLLPRGGDPSLAAMSKITTSDGKTYVPKSGTITPTKAFNRGDAYAGLSGTIECELQEIKLGNPDDPANAGDKPVGDSIKATGTFTAKAVSYPFEQL
jgi:hypothetical protein